MSDLTPISTDLLLLSLEDRVRGAAAGDPEAATEAPQLLDTLLHALAAGAALPHALSAAVAPETDSPVRIDLDEDGTYLVTSPGSPDSTEDVATFEHEDQLGFDFSVPAAPAAPHSRVTGFPKPPKAAKARRGTPRHGSAGSIADHLLDPISLPDAGMPAVGSNNPIESHQAAAKGTPVWRTMKRREMFWLIADAPDGLCDFELEAITGEHHGTVSGRRNGLMNDGYVEASPLRRKTPSGNNAIVWVLTPRAAALVPHGLERRTA